MATSQETGRIVEQISLKGLKALLDQGGVDYSGWGQIPSSRPIEKLHKDINAGECRLAYDTHGRLIREIEQVGVFVFARDDLGRLFILREDHQVFNDGIVRNRNLEGVSFREKLNILSEGFYDAVWRGLKEELPEIYEVQSQVEPRVFSNLILRVDTYRPPEIKVERKNYQSSFPGLPNRSMEYRYTMMIDPKAYKPEGYVTRENDKTTYSLWERVKPNHPFLPATAWQKMTLDQRLKVMNKLESRIPNIMGLPLEIVMEYLLLSQRFNQLDKEKELEFGSRFELEAVATSFRLMDLEKIYPKLKSLKNLRLNS